MTTCAFPACTGTPNRNGMCHEHRHVRIASAWSSAGEDEGHRVGGEE